MGCGTSKDFEGYSTTTPDGVEGQEGKCVVVVGRVSAAESVIIPPFGSGDAGAIGTRAMNEWASSLGITSEKQVFSGVSAVDFRICGAGGANVQVNMTRMQDWKFDMLETHVAWCVAYDPAKGGIVSTPEGRGKFSKRKLNPEAKKWYDEFKKQGAKIHHVGEHGLSFNGQSKGSKFIDKVRERSIQVGDAVAVVGTLKLGEKGMFMDRGIITNNPNSASQLRQGGCTLPGREKSQSSANKVPMAKLAAA